MTLPLLIVWDSSDSPTDQTGLVYRWNHHDETESVRSLFRYVEVNGERLRKKYLEWIHDLGESRLKGKRLIDHLSFDDGLSFWWMSLLVEKSFYKSPISEAIRLLAIEEILNENKPDKLRLVSSNDTLHNSLSILCQSLGVDYEWKKLTVGARRLSLRGIYQALPLPLRAFFSLFRFLADRWPFRRLADVKWFSGNRAIFFCSYFIHLDQTSCENGRYSSSFWGELPRLIHKKGFHTNWIQHYLKSSMVPDTGCAIKWIHSFNQSCNEEGFHTFLDSYLSFRIVWLIFKRWLWLNWMLWMLGRPEEAFHPKKCRVSMWPIMKKDWQDSMHGPAAIFNLLWIELFDQAMKEIPYQKKGFYLCENQSWERALIHAWHKHGHGQLIGVPHSTVRFWDLRYFTDPRTLQLSGTHPLPQQDLTVLNGRAAVTAYRSVDYPMKTIVESEALRYGYLSNLHTVGRLKPNNEMFKILILGDYNATATIKLLRLIEKAVLINPCQNSFILKPHPNYMVKSEDYPSLKLKIVMNPLQDILLDCDIACTTNSTSASVDAYIAGLPVIVLLDDMELNFSPLRGQPKVRFVSKPEELSESFREAIQDSQGVPDHNDFFFLDPALPKWQKFLGASFK